MWDLIVSVPGHTDRSKAVLLLGSVECSCCPYLYIGLAIMLVTYFSKC